MSSRYYDTSELDSAHEAGYRDGYEQGWKDALLYNEGYEPDVDEDPYLTTYEGD